MVRPIKVTLVIPISSHLTGHVGVDMGVGVLLEDEVLRYDMIMTQ